MEEDASTKETTTTTVMVVPIVAIMEERKMVNKTAHVQVLGNTFGAMGCVPTVFLSVREKQKGVLIQQQPSI